MGKTYVFDLESDGLLDTITRIHCMVLIDVETEEVHRFSPNNIRSGLEMIEQADKLIAHNGINFDYPAVRKLFPELKLPPIIDTIVLARLMFAELKVIDKEARLRKKDYPLPPKLTGSHSLKAWGYRLGELKGDFGETTDWSAYTPEMLEYCVQDCWVTLKLYRYLMEQDFAPEAIRLEHEFATIISRQMIRGWKFDEEAASRLYAELVGKRAEIKEQMSQVFGGWWEDMKTPEWYEAIAGNYFLKAPTKTALEKKIRSEILDATLRKAAIASITMGPMKRKHTPFNPSSRQHIYRVFKEKYNWKPQVFTDNGEPKVDDEVLAKLPYEEAKILAEYFMLDKRIGQIAEGTQGWLRLVTKEGRIHGSVNTNGAVTGRCTHSHPNVAQTPAKGVPYGKECRALWVASPGMVIVGADASGLELRCLAHYMGYWDKGAYAKVLLEGDIHAENQRAAGLPTRDNAKTFIYGFLYGAGDEKIGQIVGSGRQTGAMLREKFLKTLPALGKLVESVKAAAGKGHIKGLDGRKLKVRSKHAALNTLLQSAGAIAMKKALIIADGYLQKVHKLKAGEDFEFIGNIHDEIQMECKPELADLCGQILVQAIQDAGKHFNFACPLDGEYKKGASWLETH